MPRLLVVHHTPSPAVHAMLDAVLEGARDPQIEGVEVNVRAALAATTSDVLTADGFVLGTPANLGYMSGALKHFFDSVYYPCIEDTKGRPYGLYVHGNNDTDGAANAVERIVTGLGWKKGAEVVTVMGQPSQDDLDACRELGAVLAAVLANDL